MAKAIIVADIHLGFRAFSATVAGRNQREVDVENAWAAAVAKIVEVSPDLVLVGGDVVHHPRVGMHAVKAWREGVRRIVEETEAHVVVVLGNHDVGRSSDVLSPVVLPDDYERVYIVTKPERIQVCTRMGELISVACFPFTVREPGTPYLLEPDPEADTNCVLLHAAARTTADGADALPKFYAGPESIDIGREAERFNLIACGDYHTFTRLHPTALACYPGSLERTSSNIWAEPEQKGIVLADTDAKTLDFIEVPTRPMYDESTALRIETAEDLNAFLHHMLPVEEYDGAIVRLKVPDFPRAERDHIAWEKVRALQSRCTAFLLDLRYKHGDVADLGDRRERTRGLSLADEAAAFFADDSEDVRALALAYLDVVADVEDGEEVVA